MFNGLVRSLAGLSTFAALASCGLLRPGVPTPAPEAGLSIAAEDVVAPEILDLETEAIVVAEAEATGIWAAVPGLDRPERGLLESRATGASTVAALFRSRPGGETLISRDAARALGLDPAGTADIRIRAVRSELQVRASPTGF